MGKGELSGDCPPCTAPLGSRSPIGVGDRLRGNDPSAALRVNSPRYPWVPACAGTTVSDGAAHPVSPRARSKSRLMFRQWVPRQYTLRQWGHSLNISCVWKT